ncbi:MAG: TrmH family RNA methyltransferase [Caldilineaceae bacterium]
MYQVKHYENVGVLWRGAYQLGAAFIFTIGKRYKPTATDVHLTWTHIPLYNFATFDEFMAALPYSCPLIGVEMGGTSLPGFSHPQQAVYLLGAEDSGLPNAIVAPPRRGDRAQRAPRQLQRRPGRHHRHVRPCRQAWPGP